MHQNKATKRPLGSESLGILLEHLQNGTLSEISNDWKWILTYTRRYRRPVFLYTVLGVISSTLGLVSAVAGKYTIDIITGYDSARLWLVLTTMLLSALIGLLLRSATSRISTRIALRVSNDIQAEVFDDLLAAKWRDLNHFSSGDLLNRLSNDVNTVSGNAIYWLPDLIIAAYSLLATLAVVLYYDPIMALLTLASAPFLLLASRRMIGEMHNRQQKVRRASSALMAYETEALHNLDAIKGFGITAHYSMGLRRQQNIFADASLDYNMFSIRTEAVLSLLGSAVQLTAFCYCLYLLWSGKIYYGTMTLFLSQGAKLTSAFNSLVRTVPSFLSASVSARRIRELCALPPEPALHICSRIVQAAASGLTVCVEDVNFAYIPAQQVLQHVNFSAIPGEITALVGPSGGGKTTIIRLLLGMIHPDTGQAYLRTTDGETVEMNAALRTFFSYVPQGNTLLSGTIAENLRMVRPDASEPELEYALRAACAWDFVEKMPDGIFSTVGEHGHGLSEGQAQRIAIARALLRNAPILLLDEATSALDVATERKILQNLVQQFPRKTCIVTTHRPTVISLCRHVYQISDGVLHELSSDEAQRLAMEF